MRILLTGGGSGGHFYPLIAITEAIDEIVVQNGYKRPEFFYMGPEPYDSKNLGEHGITFVYCPSGKMRRYFSIKNFTDPFKVVAGLFVALYKLYFIYPDVVMSKGSFTSVPIILAAWFYRIPIVVHESDVKPGRANALGARLAKYVAISYPTAAEFFDPKKTTLTGMPMRAELLAKQPTAPVTSLGVSGSLPIISIFGGSLGAEHINSIVLQALPELLQKYDVVHQTGAVHEALVTASARELIVDPNLISRYHPFGFLTVEGMNAALSYASLIISRAGSGQIFEIAHHGTPSILIPIRAEVSHDQEHNALTYARTGAAVVMNENNATPHILISEIDRIIGNAELCTSMRTAAKGFAPLDAGKTIGTMLLDIGYSH